MISKNATAEFIGWIYLPGAAAQVTRTFKVPFVRASREDDYRIAWKFFVDQTTGENQ